MKFIVCRTSTYFTDTPPCKNAFKEEIICIDERSTDDPMSNIHIGEKWYTEEGYFNHRVEGGHIKRDYKQKQWMLEIDSLESLIDFVKAEGDVVI